VGAGFVTPERGPRNAWLFSFQDLIVLRTAQSLAAANVPQRRIVKSIRELRKNLPESLPLSGLSISAVGDRVAVKEGRSRWEADSGQYFLEFEGDPASGDLHVVPKEAPPAATNDADAWFARGAELEEGDAAGAMQAYAQALAADPAHLDASINLGRMLHDARHHVRALQVYMDALDASGADPVLLFNLGVLLDDMNRSAAAVAAYEGALKLDPFFVDAHYNLALLYKRLRQPRAAIRHMAEYRKGVK
jgi:tetratricopeptide (TPR) repeat protein